MQGGQVAAVRKRQQRLGNFPREAGTLVGVLGEQPVDHGRQGRGDVGPQIPDRLGRVGQTGQQPFHRRAVLRVAERHVTAEQFVQSAAQRVDVSSDIHGVTVGDLFRRHVIGRAHHLAGGRHLLGANRFRAEQGQTQIEDLQLRLGT